MPACPDIRAGVEGPEHGGGKAGVGGAGNPGPRTPRTWGSSVREQPAGPAAQRSTATWPRGDHRGTCQTWFRGAMGRSDEGKPLASATASCLVSLLCPHHLSPFTAQWLGVRVGGLKHTQVPVQPGFSHSLVTPPLFLPWVSAQDASGICPTPIRIPGSSSERGACFKLLLPAGVPTSFSTSTRETPRVHPLTAFTWVYRSVRSLGQTAF